jgi:hypothetical protein
LFSELEESSLANIRDSMGLRSWYNLFCIGYMLGCGQQ